MPQPFGRTSLQTFIPMPQVIRQTATVPSERAGERLDHVAVVLFPDFSRSQLQTWIRAGELRVDGKTRRPRDTMFGGEALELNAEQEALNFEAQDLPLDVVFEDDALLVINKPAGLVVHPGQGNPDATVLNAVLHRLPGNSVLPRAGIVHRLDKDTTGLMVIARTSGAQNELVAQLQAHTVRRVYDAVVYGLPPESGTIDEPMGRHPVHRTRMAVREGGKPAITHYEVIGWFEHHSLVRVRLETGRTHQIRVHMAHLGFPLVGDPVYSRLKLPKHSEPLREAIRGFPRQALHAGRLAFIHPETREEVAFRAPRPADLAGLIRTLSDEY